MVRTGRGDDSDERLARLLAGPSGRLIQRASETMQALKLGFRIELRDVPADEFAVMCLIERETNSYQIEQMRAQQNGSTAY
jgi:hypothetical protein